MTDRQTIQDLVSISAECGHLTESAHHVVRQALRVSENAQALQARIAIILGRALVDGHATFNDVLRALNTSPQAQEGGAAVTDVTHASEVGTGSADEGSAHGDGGPRVHSPEVEQALAAEGADPSPSNPVPAPSLEDQIDRICSRGNGVRGAVIDLWHETDASPEVIAQATSLSVSHVLRYVENARNVNDARILRGDVERGLSGAVE